MNYIPEPVTRTDKYLAYIAGNMDVALPDHPITRKEHYLAAWAEKSGFEDVDVAGEPPLTLENAIGKPLKGLRIYGKSTQVTTTGAQLLNLKDECIIARDGVTIKILDNGCLFVNGTPLYTYMGVYSEKLALSPGKYHFSGNYDGPGSVYGQIFIAKEDGSTAYYTDDSFTVDGSEKDITLAVQNGKDVEHIDNYVLYLMLSKGDTQLPWEPYTGGKPSPSPDYPQEIESVGTKWSTGANLVDVHNAIKINVYGLAVAVKDDGTIIISGTSNNNSKNLSFSFLNNKFPFPLTSIFKCFDVEEKNCKLSSVRRTNTSDATNNGIAIDINQINSGEPIYCSFKLVVSEKAVEEYEPYTGGVPKPYGDKIGVNVRGKNLIPFPYPLLGGAGTKTELNGVTYTVQEDGGVRCIGTPNSVFGVSLSMIRFSDKPLSVGGPTDGKVVLSGGPLYFDSNNKKLFFFFDTKQVGNPIDTVIYPQIELGTVATPYEPYREPQSMSISVPNGLPGIQVASGGNYTDADGRQWICDEVDFARGVYVQRVWKGVFDGSDDERWEIYNNTTYAGFYLTNVFAEKLTMRDGIANTYKVDNSYIPIEAVWIRVNEKAIYIKNSRFYDDTLSDKGLSNFKDSLAAHPMVVMTYLDSPIETPLTSDQLAAYKQLHTYKGTTIIDNDAGAYMSVRYEKMK